MSGKLLWTKEPGGLQNMGSQRVRHDWVTHTHTLINLISQEKIQSDNFGVFFTELYKFVKIKWYWIFLYLLTSLLLFFLLFNFFLFLISLFFFFDMVCFSLFSLFDSNIPLLFRKSNPILNFPVFMLKILHAYSSTFHS